MGYLANPSVHWIRNVDASGAIYDHSVQARRNEGCRRSYVIPPTKPGGLARSVHGARPTRHPCERAHGFGWFGAIENGIKSSHKHIAAVIHCNCVRSCEEVHAEF